jgi:integrase
MMVVTLHTGMRRGELFGLKWEDIDFAKKKINIVRSYDGPTKSGKPRSVPMSDSAADVLTSCYNGQDDDEHCFNRCDPNPRLKKLQVYVYGTLELKRKTISWHGLRHTFATLALEAGRSPKLVSEMLGHSKVSTTLDLYWNKSGEDLDLGFLPKGDFK